MLASDWHKVDALLSDHPKEVAHLLFDAQEFPLAKKLVDTHKNPDSDLKLVRMNWYISILG